MLFFPVHRSLNRSSQDERKYTKLHNQDQAEVHTPICLISKFVFLPTFCSSSSDIYNYQERLARKDSLQFNSVRLLSCVWLFVTPWTAAHQASLSITNSKSLLKLRSIESVMPSNHLTLCCPLLLPPSIFPSIRVFSNASALHLYVTSLISINPVFSVQSLSHVRLFATPWTTACQASLSITNSQSPPKPMSIESVMLSYHLTLCCPLLLLPSILPSIRVFPMTQLFSSGPHKNSNSSQSNYLW